MTTKTRSKSPRQQTDSDSGGSTVAGVTLTHAERVLFADTGVTKLDLARYYEEIAPWILPGISERALTLVRCPDGSTGQCFYQKHWTKTLPAAVDFIPIKEKSTTDKYIVIHDLAGLISLVQISALELHVWGSRIDRLENPDQVIFDLDPGPGVDWDQVVQAATDVRDVLAEMGLTSFVRTSGGKGLHVVAPLVRRATWEDVTTFAHDIADGLAAHADDRYIANMRKALRKKKVFVDYHRNQRGATAVASYSTRNRPGCPVAAPVEWKELKRLKGADEFTIESMPRRLKKLRHDPWEGFTESRQSITKEILERAREFSQNNS